MYFSLLFLCIQAFSAFGMEQNGLDFYEQQNSSDNKYIQKNYVENLYYVSQKGERT